MKSRLDLAASIAGFNPEKIDLALLVGMMVRIQRWHEYEPHIVVLKKESMCSSIRAEGEALIERESLKKRPELDGSRK